MSLDIKGFIETSLVDWDGKIVAVVFLPGCNFRCSFCHNMGLIDHPEKYKSIPDEKIFQYLESHKAFIDGVCITGGEPTLQMDLGLTEFIRRLKKDGFLVKLDTNGTDPGYIKRLVADNLIDFVAMDIKGPLDMYTKIANVKVDLTEMKKSIDFLLGGSVDYEFRTTVIPTYIGIPEIENISELIEGAKKYVLQQFEPENCSDIELKKLKPVDRDTIAKMLKIAHEKVKSVHYRGK